MQNFNNMLISTMKMERAHKIRSGIIYGLTQREFAYNSNKIEGSRLTKEHISTLFNTGSIYAEECEFRAKDVEEATGHFTMFNFMLDTLSAELSENLIKEFHKKLKQGVFHDTVNGYAIGEYKKRINYVDNIDTALPNEVVGRMEKLLTAYMNNKKSLENIIKFHVEFERIHPFQDGNGRVGRIVMFRECLVNDIVPFIIRDTNKAKYIDTLNKAQMQGDISKIVSYIKEEQEWYYKKVQGALF